MCSSYFNLSILEWVQTNCLVQYKQIESLQCIIHIILATLSILLSIKSFCKLASKRKCVNNKFSVKPYNFHKMSCPYKFFWGFWNWIWSKDLDFEFYAWWTFFTNDIHCLYQLVAGSGDIFTSIFRSLTRGERQYRWLQWSKSSWDFFKLIKFVLLGAKKLQESIRK